MKIFAIKNFVTHFVRVECSANLDKPLQHKEMKVHVQCTLYKYYTHVINPVRLIDTNHNFIYEEKS